MRQKLYPISVKITNAHCTLLSQLQFAEPPNTNLRLAEKGEKLLERALLGYVRAAFPYLPEEGVHAFVDFLRQGRHLYLYLFICLWVYKVVHLVAERCLLTSNNELEVPPQFKVHINKVQPLIPCQQKVVLDQMDHPVPLFLSARSQSFEDEDLRSFPGLLRQ